VLARGDMRGQCAKARRATPSEATALWRSAGREILREILAALREPHRTRRRARKPASPENKLQEKTRLRPKGQPSPKLPCSVRVAHQEHFTLIAGGTMVGKQIKSLLVRFEEHEPHFPAAQGACNLGGHEMRACRRRRHDRHCTSPGKEYLDATQRNPTRKVTMTQ
jgi:hypothetical protein